MIELNYNHGSRRGTPGCLPDGRWSQLNKVFLSGYAKLPDKTTAQKLYDHLVLVVTADPVTGEILDADCTMATGLGRSFIQELLTGYDLRQGPEPLIRELNRCYYGHLRKSLQTCIRAICLQFGTIEKPIQ